MLDNIKIEKLENGFTVKFHVENDYARTSAEMEQGVPGGFSMKIYCKDKTDLVTQVVALIEKFTKEPKDGASRVDTGIQTTKRTGA